MAGRDPLYAAGIGIGIGIGIVAGGSGTVIGIVMLIVIFNNR